MEKKDEYVEYLHRYWAKQKAVGMVAEAQFLEELEESPVNAVSDVMLFQPKPENNEFQPWQNIYAFILDAADRDELTKDEIIAAELMERSGTTVIFPRVDEQQPSTLLDLTETEAEPPVEKAYNWVWRSYNVERETLEVVQIEEETEAWRTRGYATEDDTDYLSSLDTALAELSAKALQSMFYKEHFFSCHLKGEHSFTGTYFDIDGLLVDGEITIPYEIKEKSVYEGSTDLFGLDVSRLIVMLRVALTQGLDPVYVVREVEEADEYHEFERDFIDWWSIRLSDVIRASAWQIQGGGPGMTGGRTQTLMIPRSEFNSITFDSLELNNYTNLVENFQAGIGYCSDES